MSKFLAWRTIGVLIILVFALQFLLSAACDHWTRKSQSPKLSALEEFYKRNGRSWTVWLSSDQQRVTSVVGRSTKAYSGQASEKASHFLRENFDILGLQSGLGDLRIIGDKVTPFGAHVELQQVFKELPVENGRIQINFDKEGHVVQVENSYTPTAGSLDQASKSKDQATETAIEDFLRTTPVFDSKLDEQQRTDRVTVNPKPPKANRVAVNPKQQKANHVTVNPKQQKTYGATANPKPPKAVRATGNPKQPKAVRVTLSRKELGLAQQQIQVEDVFFVSNDRLRRAYKTLISADNPFGIKEIVIDANSGEVLQTRDFVYNAVDGTGQVFIPNPVNSLRVSTLDDNDDDNGAVTDNHANPYIKIPLLGLDAPVEGHFRLRGPFVTLEEIQPPAITSPTPANPDDFVFERNADGFEDVMVYYHIDRIQRYIQSLGLGFDIMNRPIKVDAHACFGADASRYVSPPDLLGKGHLLFGEGGVDDAEDADLIAHEYGHAIQDDQAHKKYSGRGWPKAMGEGFADYWAVSSYSAETLLSELPCVGEWDKPHCLRRLDKSLGVSSFVQDSSPHVNGLIWSGTLLGIFDSLGKRTADSLILLSHFNVPDNPSVVQGANAIITADRQFSGGANLRTLCSIFKSRGIYRREDCPPLP